MYMFMNVVRNAMWTREVDSRPLKLAGFLPWHWGSYLLYIYMLVWELVLHYKTYNYLSLHNFWSIIIMFILNSYASKKHFTNGHININYSIELYMLRSYYVAYTMTCSRCKCVIIFSFTFAMSIRVLALSFNFRWSIFTFRKLLKKTHTSILLEILDFYIG